MLNVKKICDNPDYFLILKIRLNIGFKNLGDFTTTMVTFLPPFSFDEQPLVIVNVYYYYTSNFFI